MTYKKKRAGKMIKIEKTFTYQDAGQLKDNLIRVLHSDTGAKISLSGIESTDLTALQLLVSATSSFKKANTPLHIEMECNEETSSLITNCGFKYLITK